MPHARELLNIVRDFGERQEEVAKEGFYQSMLEARKPLSDDAGRIAG